MSSHSDDQEQWKDISESSSISEDDQETGILEELELGHVRRIDQENEPPNLGEPSTKRLRLLESSVNVNVPVLPVPVRYDDRYLSYFWRPEPFGSRPLKKLDGPSPFDSISDEVIVKIFSFLPRSSLGKCAPVCKRFQRIALDPKFWKAIKMYKKNVPAGVIGNTKLMSSYVLIL